MSFHHEISHLFGAKHNREHHDSEDYGHGYHIANTPFCTIMAYPGTRPLYGSTPVRRIPYYSNRIWTVNGGNPMGDAENDNRRKLTDTRSVLGPKLILVRGCENVDGKLRQK